LAVGETNLKNLLGSMKPLVKDGVFVFVTMPANDPLPSGIDPIMSFRETEGRTLIITEQEAASLGLSATFHCRMVTLQIHSSLEAVGFLAAITTKLASAGMGVNPVSAFYHDHLFLAVHHVDEAMRLLEELAVENR
jgi:uncharacterized protein